MLVYGSFHKDVKVQENNILGWGKHCEAQTAWYGWCHLLTASFLKLGAMWHLNSALRALVSNQSLNSEPFWKTAGSGRGGPKSGTDSLAVTATLYTVWSVLACSTWTTMYEWIKWDLIMFGQNGVFASCGTNRQQITSQKLFITFGNYNLEGKQVYNSPERW